MVTCLLGSFWLVGWFVSGLSMVYELSWFGLVVLGYGLIRVGWFVYFWVWVWVWVCWFWLVWFDFHGLVWVGWFG